MGGVTLTVKQTVKQIVPIDMNTEIPKSLLLRISVASDALKGQLTLSQQHHNADLI